MARYKDKHNKMIGLNLVKVICRKDQQVRRVGETLQLKTVARGPTLEAIKRRKAVAINEFRYDKPL